MKEMQGMFRGSRPDVKKAIMKAAKHFEEEFNLEAKPLCIEELSYGFPLWIAKFKEVGSPSLRTSMSYGKTPISIWWEILKSLFGLSDHTFPLLFFSAMTQSGKGKNFYKALEIYKALEKKFENIFQEDAIFLYPTHPEPAPHFFTTIPKAKNAGHACIFNILGFPCTAVPAGLSEGLPISIQVISGPLKDHLTIAAAQELDKIFGGWKSPCSIRV
ncbi:fatty-acid amide hydrolase 2-B [Trichonephila clavata]|uniref:Fatty-acid amide hydrolase 2-B n=1 Tax=Trichonephila clavata TaxID=2740835 RepID=A0A8X6IAT0_TRICU|nr:fatty-acid amide hydrolase 2-B [Trichonephila clavata]